MNVPKIADDVLHCSIFPSVGTNVDVLASQISRYVEQLLPNHIWHRDSFQLVLSKDLEGTLECTMRVGDSVDDEWLVVWLLFQISKEFNVVANVYDADGEFLLIEAADVLPAWVTPENAANRVWVSQGHLHLLPLSYVSPSSTKPKPRRQLNEQDRDLEISHEHEQYISPEDAVKFVRDPFKNTQAPDEVQNVIFLRISKYPAAMSQHVHRTKAALPVDIARSLRANPSLIQRAVECFYTRDEFQLRATQKMTRFPPSPSVTVTVKMSRTAYAQLCGQRFNAPRVFKRPLGQTMQEERWWDIGAKIACGFEMLYQEARTRKEGLRENGSSEMLAAQLDALHRDSAYLKYTSALENANYFEGEIPDSQQWKAKEREAAKVWLQIRRDDDAIRPSFTDEVNAALSSAPAQQITWDEGEDPDDWLEITQRDLEKSLNAYMSTEPHNRAYTTQDTSMGEAEEDVAATEQAARLKRLAEKVDAFVEGKGDLSGAMFEDELSDSSDEQESDGESEGEDKAAKRRAAMDALVAPLEPGEYGKMPPEYRHQNSQRTAPATMESEPQSSVRSPPKTTTSADFSLDPPHKPFRRPIWKDKFDGVDSDDETTDEEGEGLGSDEEGEEDHPQVVDEVEIDMEQEQEEFLRFTREALGIDDQAWEKIINEREKRGAYVPILSPTNTDSQAGAPRSTTQSDLKVGKESTSQGPSAARFFDEIPKLATTPRAPRPPRTGPRPNANPDLDSFEAVMEAMEKELERLKSRPVELPPKAPLASSWGEDKSTAPKERGKAVPPQITVDDDGGDEDEDMGGIEQQMDAELKAALEKDHEVVSSEEDDEIDDEPPMDYTMIKNFLESFKSQQGMAGPVSGLAGRLNGAGWIFPRDES